MTQKGSRGGSRTLRIIGGRWRSRQFRFQDVQGLRPTPDRVRETLFNWLQMSVAGEPVLDLFAGSGALSFEALSRGASSATLLERDRQQAQTLRDIAQQLVASDAHIVEADSLHWLANAPEPERAYHIIFLDPPFHQDLVAKALAALVAKAWLLRAAWVYIETELAPEAIPVPDGLLLHRQARAGMVYALLYRVDVPS